MNGVIAVIENRYRFIQFLSPPTPMSKRNNK